MNETFEKHPLRIVLRAGSAVFGASALFLLALPALFLELLALPTGEDQIWSMRMIAVTLVALTGNMLVVSLYANVKGVRFASRVMQIAAFGLGALTLVVPAELTWFTYLYAAVGFGFSAAYTVLLFRRK
jgi:O-antigen/teichoic acid export membrane protein